jgi:hypothetical protein
MNTQSPALQNAVPTPQRFATLTQPRGLDGSPLAMRGLQGDADLQGLCQLFSDVFAQPVTLAQWRWKYMQAPDS